MTRDIIDANTLVIRTAKPLLRITTARSLYRRPYVSNVSCVASGITVLTRYLIDSHNLVMRAGKPLLGLIIDPILHQLPYFSNAISEISGVAKD